MTLHLLIEVFLNVGPFSLVTLSFYACLWHPDAWGRLFRRLARTRGAAGEAEVRC